MGSLGRETQRRMEIYSWVRIKFSFEIVFVSYRPSLKYEIIVHVITKKKKINGSCQKCMKCEKNKCCWSFSEV